MLTSKHTNSSNYLKPSHSKNKPHSKPASPQPVPDSSHKQNIYDSLLGALQHEDSQYIVKLLQKQERKSKKKQQSNNKASTKATLVETTNQMHSTNSKNAGEKTNRSVQQSKLSSPRASQSKQVKIEQSRPQYQPKLRTNISSQSLPHHSNLKSASNNFIDNINTYLTLIKQSQPNRVDQQRQFRKTIQLADRRHCQPHQTHITAKKYNSVLSELQRLLTINDHLEQKVQSQQEQIHKMKQLIRNMFYQVQYLQQQLHHEQHQKAKYSQVLHQFSAEISKMKDESHSTRHRSHKKRNSYIPHCSASFAQQSEPQITANSKYRELMQNHRHFDLSYLHKQNESTPLKKRGKLHRYKISDGCLDILDESQSTASIYKERYRR